MKFKRGDMAIWQIIGIILAVFLLVVGVIMVVVLLQGKGFGGVKDLFSNLWRSGRG